LLSSLTSDTPFPNAQYSRAELAFSAFPFVLYGILVKEMSMLDFRLPGHYLLARKTHFFPLKTATGSLLRFFTPDVSDASGMNSDHLCGLVVRVPGYRSGDPWFDSWLYQIL
jgi:hypothetical protein